MLEVLQKKISLPFLLFFNRNAELFYINRKKTKFVCSSYIPYIEAWATTLSTILPGNRQRCCKFQNCHSNLCQLSISQGQSSKKLCGKSYYPEQVSSSIPHLQVHGQQYINTPPMPVRAAYKFQSQKRQKQLQTLMQIKLSLFSKINEYI